MSQLRFWLQFAALNKVTCLALGGGGPGPLPPCRQIGPPANWEGHEDPRPFPPLLPASRQHSFVGSGSNSAGVSLAKVVGTRYLGLKGQSGRRLKMKVLVGGGRGSLLASSPWLSWDGHQSSGCSWLFGLGWDWTGRSGSRPSPDPCGPTRLSRPVPSEGHFWGWLQPGGATEPS